MILVVGGGQITTTGSQSLFVPPGGEKTRYGLNTGSQCLFEPCCCCCRPRSRGRSCSCNVVGVVV